MGTIIVAMIVIFVIGLAIYSIYKDKKAGRSILCGGDCSHCSGSCHKEKVDRADIEK